MGWLFDLVMGLIVPNIGGILAGIGGAVAIFLAFFAGKKDERQKGEIKTQGEVIDAYQDRTAVEDRLSNADPAKPGSVRERYTRD